MKARLPRMGTKGNASFTTTVLLSGAVTDSIGAEGLTECAMSPRALDLVENLFQLNTTSSASRGRLFVGGLGSNNRFGRSLNVTCMASPVSSHDSAASASTEPSAGLSKVPT